MKLFLLLAVLAAVPDAQDYSNLEVPAIDSLRTVDVNAPKLTLEDALKVAMSENIPVKVADKEIMRKTYAKRGTYAALYPNIDGSFAYQRTIKKQRMYADIPGMEGGMEVGRFNNWNAGVTATMPIVNAQLWKSLQISADDVELAVEKARGSRLEMVTQVKSAYYAVLLAKEALNVYLKVYDNAVKNFEVTRSKYLCQRASEMDLLQARTTVANSIPDIYNSCNSVDICLWQLKAVMGVDLEYNMDVTGSLEDYAQQMFYDMYKEDNYNLSRNTSLKQLDIQVEELRKTVQASKLAYVPSLALAFNYTYSAMENSFNFSEYKWTPYSYVGLTISVPIFSGMKRYNDVKQSQVSYQQLQLTRTNTERQLKIAVKSDLSTMETGMKSYYSSQTAVAGAQKSYDISEESYKVGRSTLVELNTAMLALVTAELSQWEAVYSFLVAKADLEQQLGKDYIQE